jgi:protein SMG9
LSADNTDFTVVGVIGAPGVGKSTILNELYGFDGTTSGVLPPFQVQSEETRAMARHCSVGIELRMSVERFILLDTQVCKKFLLVSPVGEFHVKKVTLEPLAS